MHGPHYHCDLLFVFAPALGLPIFELPHASSSHCRRCVTVYAAAGWHLIDGDTPSAGYNCRQPTRTVLRDHHQNQTTQVGSSLALDHLYTHDFLSQNPRLLDRSSCFARIGDRALPPTMATPHATSLTEGQLYSISVIERVNSVFSLLGSLFIIVTFCFSKAFHKPINRLVFYASFGNMLTNVGTLMSRSYNETPDAVGCQFQAFLIQMYASFLHLSWRA